MILKKQNHYGGHFDIDSRLKELEEYEKQLASPNVWDDKEHADLVIAEIY